MSEQQPSTFSVGYAYVALMGAAGIGLALLFKASPSLGEVVPGLLWLLGASLVFDLVNNQRVSAGQSQPLEMPWRVGGFIAGALLHIGLVAVS